MINKVKTYLKEHQTVAEIIRFLIVGGIATLVDIFVMGTSMYFMQQNIYPHFYNAFFNTPNPSTCATILGTSLGFLAGLIVNYILSIIFVYINGKNGRTLRGFFIFTILSLIGLGINALGMYIGYNVLRINQWIVKIVMIFVVLIYNYISKKLILFKADTTTN